MYRIHCFHNAIVWTVYLATDREALISTLLSLADHSYFDRFDIRDQWHQRIASLDASFIRSLWRAPLFKNSAKALASAERAYIDTEAYVDDLDQEEWYYEALGEDIRQFHGLTGRPDITFPCGVPAFLRQFNGE